jgi:hypothetical protein
VASDIEKVLTDQASGMIEPDEEILAAVVAQPRGTSVSRSGVNLGASMVGDAWAGKSRGGAESAGLELTTPMAPAVSQKRLLVFELETSGLGKPKGVKELHSSVPIEDVQSIKVGRLLVGKTLKVAVNGGEVKLEVGAGQNVKGLVEQFERARAAA